MREDGDELLVQALRERPEFPIPGDLAASAMARVRQHQARRAALLRLAQRARFFSVIAGALVITLIVLALALWPVSSSESSGAMEVSSSGELAGWQTLAGVVLACVSAVVLWRTATLREERLLRPV
jgi:hypothetical protein